MVKKILFADDDEDIRYVAEILLKTDGYDVVLESDTHFADNPDPYNLPDVYLLDRHMHGSDLLHTCRLLKANPVTSHIPVIMVSADAQIQKLFEEAGADEFVQKPFERYQLLDAVARVLRKSDRETKSS